MSSPLGARREICLPYVSYVTSFCAYVTWVISVEGVMEKVSATLEYPKALFPVSLLFSSSFFWRCCVMLLILILSLSIELKVP